MAKPHLDKLNLSSEEQATAARLRKHVDLLADIIGERHWWRYDHLMAAEKYVRDQLALTGHFVAHQEYTVINRPVRNLICEQRGAETPEEIVILGAHYDSVEPTPGADDNASGVAGVLEVAHQLVKRKFKRTIRYVSFVNEEPPFYKSDDMGSLRYARLCRARNDNIVGMINLEMIGYFDDAPKSQRYPILPRKWYLPRLERWFSDRGNFIVICGDFPSLPLLLRVKPAFKKGSKKFPLLAFPSPRFITGPDMSDNWSFWQMGYPALMVTDTSFFRNDNYHTIHDRVGTLHYPAMTRVVGGIASAVAKLAGPCS